MNEDMFNRHIVPAKEFKIGEDTFHFKPLSYQDLPLFWKLVQKFDSMKSSLPDTKDGEEMTDEQTSQMLKLFDEETVTNLLKLSIRTVEVSYPDLAKDKVEAFARDNMFTLMNVIIELNTPKTQADVAKAKQVIQKDGH